MAEGNFAEIIISSKESSCLSVSLYDPSNRDLLEDGIYSIYNNLGSDIRISFIAQLRGEYRLSIRLEKSESENLEKAKVDISYTNTLRLPTGKSKIDLRKLNGYEIKILNYENQDEKQSIFLIEKRGELKVVLRWFDFGGFYFSDDPNQAFSQEEKRSAMLM
ncbi:MAG: hypothetical protein SNJ62_04875, partial [Chloracidobacterium sp.]